MLTLLNVTNHCATSQPRAADEYLRLYCMEVKLAHLWYRCYIVLLRSEEGVQLVGQVIQCLEKISLLTERAGRTASAGPR